MLAWRGNVGEGIAVERGSVVLAFGLGGLHNPKRAARHFPRWTPHHQIGQAPSGCASELQTPLIRQNLAGRHRNFLPDALQFPYPNFWTTDLKFWVGKLKT